MGVLSIFVHPMSALTSTQKKLPVAAGALIAAAALWVSVNMQAEYSVVKSVPVVFEEMGEGKAFRYPIPKAMSVRIRGTGWVVARLFLSPDVKYFINLSTVTSEPVLITAKEIQNHVTLPADVAVVDVKPETLMVALSDYVEKRVPVSPRIVLDFHEGYGLVGEVRVEPDSVTIGGAPEDLRGVRSWSTQFRKHSDVRAPIAEDIPLEELPSYSFTVPLKSVRVSVGVEPFAEKVFSGIPVTVNGVPPGREVIFDVVVRGGIEQLAAIRDERFSASVDYSDLERDSTGYSVPALKSPERVRVIERRPQRFQFIIRKRL
jgi:YbbR domain-containing protein